MSEDIINSLYHTVFGTEPESVVLLPASGSSRRYYRVKGVRNVIATIGDNISENKAFIYLSKYFGAKNLAVPEVYGVSDDFRCYLQEDLGSTSLFDLLTADGVDSPAVMLHYHSVMKELPLF